MFPQREKWNPVNPTVNNRCPVCKVRKFKKEEALVHHINTQHLGYVTSYRCKICKKTLSNKYSYDNHMTAHEKPFHCDVCKKGYGTKSSLKRHSCGGSGDKVPCKFLGKGKKDICRVKKNQVVCKSHFANKSAMECHAKTCIGNPDCKDKDLFYCVSDDCPRSRRPFRTYQQYNRHLHSKGHVDEISTAEEAIAGLRDQDSQTDE